MTSLWESSVGLPDGCGRSISEKRRRSQRAALDIRGIGTLRYPRTVPGSEEAAQELKKRTLTNLYNHRPTWLDLAHKKLDEAVFTAYAWPPETTDDDLLAALLELNLRRADAQSR